MASGYATLADEGVHVDPTPIRLVRDAYGATILDDRFPQETEVVSAGTAYVMTSMLESVINEGTGYPNAQIGRPAAGKTGTTSDYRDAWFVGYTPDLVAAVWLGNDDYTRMNESYGGNIPARTWARFMRAALVNVAKHDFTVPAAEVHKLALCGSAKRSEYYVAGTEPSTGCAYGTGAAESGATAATDSVPTAAPVAAVRPEPAARPAKPAAAPPAAAHAKITTVELETPEPASAEKGGH
jgi:penicillin-binding protein 1A